ncbi:MAG: hypothetical protein KBA07_08305 [Petrotogaceae bacterium]|nr:hypothetical protein [Petrotogaceae bacterium]
MSQVLLNILQIVVFALGIYIVIRFFSMFLELIQLSIEALKKYINKNWSSRIAKQMFTTSVLFYVQ